MKRTLVILLALLMSLNVPAAAFAEDAAGTLMEGQEILLSEDIPSAEDIPVEELVIEVSSADELREALEASCETEKTVRLTADISGIEGTITVPYSDWTVTLDLNGFAISAADTFTSANSWLILNNGKLTVTGEGTVDVGTAGEGSRIALINTGDLTIESGTFRGTMPVFCDNGTVTVCGGTFEATSDAPTVGICGGTVVIEGEPEFSGDRIFSAHNAYEIPPVLSIKGGNYTAASAIFEIPEDASCDISIEGGSFAVTDSDYETVLAEIDEYVADCATVTVMGTSYTKENIPEELPEEEERPEIPEGTKLEGDIFGSASWEGNEDTAFDKAFDGNTSTYYDAYDATIDAHVGMDVGTPTRLTGVRIVPRNPNGYDPDITVSDSSGGFDDEIAENLFDRNLDSKWCSDFGMEESYVIWQTDRPVSVYGYQMYTANDTGGHPNRNPVSWTLYGANANEEGEITEWEPIDVQVGNYDLPAEDFALHEVYLGEETTDENGEPSFEYMPSPEYEYFKLTIDHVETRYDEYGELEECVFQLGEFRLLESPEECVRMEGMTVQGSTDGVRWADLYTFPNGPCYYVQPYVLTADDMALVNDYSFTQFRLINKEQHFNVAEVEFYGVEAAEDMEAYPEAAGEHNLLESGEMFGTDPWEEGSEFDKAFDGEPGTHYDASEEIEGYANVGISLETPAQLTKIVVHPRGEGNEYRMRNLEVQGSVNGEDWITLYRFDDVRDYEYRYYEVYDYELASAAQDYAFTQFRVINKSEHLNVAEIEFYGTYDHDLDSFPTEIYEPIYSYLTGDQFVETAWVHYERNPENPDDDHYMDWWYFNDRGESGEEMTRFEQEFEGREPIVLVGGVGFDETVLELGDIDGKPVIAVAPHAFANENDIREVIVNEDSDCKYIMNSAFARCNSIESVTVSNALRSVEDSAFLNNWNLSVFIKNDGDLSDEEKNERDWGFVEVIDGALVSRADVVVCYPPAAEPVDSYHVPDSVHHIGSFAFVGADISEITMGHNVLRINYAAFSECTAHTIQLSPSLQFLGNDAFSGCTNLTYLEIPSDGVEIDSWENENGEIEYTDWMFGNTVDSESGEPRANLVVKTYDGNMICDYINYIHALSDEDTEDDYDMSHVVFEEETEIYWYGFDWWEECGENEVFLVGYSAPLDAEITTISVNEDGVPVTYDGKTIIGIRTDGDAWQAFRYDDRVCGGEDKTFVIPEGIKYIYDVPFDACGSIETFVIPSTLENVYAPFLSCHGLKNFIVNEGGNFYTDEDGAVLYYTDKNNGEVLLAAAAANCGKTVIEVLEDTVCIMEAAFEGNRWIENVILPESLCAIDWWAFGNTPLKSITIPENVDRIMPGAFAECPDLTEVRIERKTGEFCSPDWEQDFWNVFENSPNVTVYVYEGTDAHRAAEEYGWNYEAIDVEETIYDLYTANDGVHLRRVIAKPGDTYFTIPDEVQLIDDRAFADIEGIETVVFPENLRYIGHEAFAGCGEFDAVFSGAVPMSWENDSFDEGFDFETLYNEAFFWNQHWDGDYLYYVMTEAKEVMLRGYWYTAIDNNGVMEIPSETVIGGETYYVTAIEPGSCEAGSADRLGDHVRNHAEEFGWEIADSEWTYPKTIVIPETVRYIGGRAFADHNYWDEETETHGGLTSVQLPKSVQWIGDEAFGGSCHIKEFTNLDEYGAESGNPYRLAGGSIVNTWNEDILYAYPAGSEAADYTVSDGIQVIGWGAFRDAKNLVSVMLPEGVRRTENESFAMCENLEMISLPCTLEEIWHGSFRSCNKLTEIVLPNSNEYFFVHEDGTLRADEGDTIAVLPLGLIPEDGCYEISEGVKGIWGTSAGSDRLTELVIPDSIRWINDWAFENSVNLRKVIINGTLEDDIPLNAFAWCDKLEEIEYHGDSVNLFVYDRDIEENNISIGTEHDENGDILHDEDGNRITRKFNFRLMNEDADISFVVIHDDNWAEPDDETYTPDDNPYFNLIRGASETVYGDVNGDGELSMDDALYLLRHTILSDRFPLSGGDHNYDGSEDGKITAEDAVALKNIIMMNQ